MILAVVMLAQGAVPPADFDLRRVPRTAVDPCISGRASDGSIVVCGLRDGPDPDRLEPLAGPDETLFPRAGVALGGGATASLEGEQADMPAGFVSRRAMVKLKVPF